VRSSFQDKQTDVHSPERSREVHDWSVYSYKTAAHPVPFRPIDLQKGKSGGVAAMTGAVNDPARDMAPTNPNYPCISKGSTES